MALVDIGVASLFAPFRADTANTTSTIDAADECAGIVGAVKAGNVTHIHFHTGTIAVGGVVDIRVEQLTTTGGASGNLWATTTNALKTLGATTDDNAWFRVALTSPAVFAQGDIPAVIIINPTVSFGTIQLSLALEYNGLASKFPYRLAPTRTTKTTILPIILLEYDTGDFAQFLGYLPFMRIAATIIDTGQNPDEIALYFVPDVRMMLYGYGGILSLAGSADYRVVCYTEGNDTPIASTGTRDGDVAQTTTAGVYHDLFTAPVALTAGVGYYLSVVPLTTGDVTIQAVEGPQASAFTGLTLCAPQWAQRNRSGTSDPDSASWTKTSTKIPALWPLMSKLDNGVGGGGPLVGPGRLVRS